MPTDEEVIAFVVKVENEGKVNALAAAIKLEEDNLKKLISTLGTHDAATKASASALIGLNAQLKGAGGGAKGMGQALSQAGYAVDDLQYGFKGIANNIQPILTSIPALAGLAGPISIAAIAAYQLYEHSGQIAELFGLGRTKAQAEQMEELGKKTEKTADETARLAKFEELRRNSGEQHKPSDAAAGRASAVNDAIRNAPYADAAQLAKEVHGDAFRKSIDSRLTDARDTAANQLAGAQVEQQSRNAQSPGSGDKRAREAEKRLADAQVKVDAAFGQMIEDFLAGLAGDEKGLRAFAAKARAKGRKDLAEKLEDAAKSPGQREADAADEYYRKQDEDHAGAKAKADEDARHAAEKDSEDADEYYRKQDEDHANRKAEADRKDVGVRTEKALAGTGADGRIDDALLRASLKSGGRTGVASGQVTGQVSQELQAKGLSKDEADAAAQDQVGKRAAKLGDEVNDESRKPRDRDQLDAPQRIASADFAKSVESAGSDQATKLLTTTEGMKQSLAEMLKLMQRGPRLVK